MDARSEWRPRPALSRLVRAAALSVPVLVGVATGWAVARLLPRPSGLAAATWWLAVLGLATTALVGADRLARRALPLAWLLRLTVVFPDGAPSRLLVAFRATSIPRIRRDGLIGRGGLVPADEVEDLVALATALGVHDRRTRAHSERVRALSRVVGEQLRLAGPAVQRLEWAAFLHDIGKLSVPPAILNKSGRPDPDEWRLLARHPDEGAQLAAPLVPWLGDWLRGVRDHHERWDGTGYPEGVAGPDISLAGRIVGVTDAFETMTAVRSYKRPMTAGAARAELVACAGTHFDPSVVRAFLDVSLGRLYWILGPATWLALVPLIGGLPRAVAATRVAAGSGQVTRGLRAVGLAVAATAAATSIALAPPSPSTRAASPEPVATPATPAGPAPETTPAVTTPAVTTPAPLAPPAPVPGSGATSTAPAAPGGAPATTEPALTPTSTPTSAPISGPPLLEVRIGTADLRLTLDGGLPVRLGGRG